jgi:hypothetical protein
MYSQLNHIGSSLSPVWLGHTVTQSIYLILVGPAASHHTIFNGLSTSQLDWYRPFQLLSLLSFNLLETISAGFRVSGIQPLPVFPYINLLSGRLRYNSSLWHLECMILPETNWTLWVNSFSARITKTWKASRREEGCSEQLQISLLSPIL